jgi:hypothetical protein
VQFHPEVDAATMGAMIEARRAGLEAEASARGEDPGARLRALRAGLRATPAGERILRNFAAAAAGRRTGRRTRGASPP